jgi:hypothetical protein
MARLQMGLSTMRLGTFVFRTSAGKSVSFIVSKLKLKNPRQ